MPDDSLNLYVWKVWGDYEIDFYIAIAKSVEDAKQQILDHRSEEQNDDSGDTWWYKTRKNILDNHDPEVYRLDEPMADWINYTG